MKSKKIIFVTYFVTLILLFTVFTILTLSDVLAKLDLMAYSNLSQLNADILFKVITEFGNVWIIMLITLIFIICTRKKEVIITIAVCLIGILILNNVLKICIGRTRPEGIALVEETGYSYPSSHSAVSTSFYLTLAAYLNGIKINKKWKILSILLAPMIIISIATSRIYLGIHYATDVIAGIMVGTLYFLLSYYLVNNYIMPKVNKLRISK